MQLLSNEKTSLSNKHFVLFDPKTKLYYNDDKTKTTKSLDEVADWFKCKVKNIVPVLASKYYWSRYLCILTENDKKVPTRVRISLWTLTGVGIDKIHPSDPFSGFMHDNRLGKGYVTWTSYCDKYQAYTPFVYIYNDGKISHEDATTKEQRIKNQTPHTVKSYNAINPAVLYGSVISQHALIYDLNSELIGSSSSVWSASEKTKLVIKDAGFPTQYTVGRRSYYTTETTIETLSHTPCSIIRYAVEHKIPRSVSKENKKFSDSLEPMGDKKLKIEKRADGTMFRFQTNLLPYIEAGENGRLFISNKGAISQSIIAGQNSETKDWKWTAINTKPNWFYAAMYENRDSISPDDYHDIVKYNSKYKYINDYINKDSIILLGLNIKSTYDSVGIVEFLRMAKKHPVVVDTLLKLGYENIFTSCERVANSYTSNASDNGKILDIKCIDYINKALESSHAWSYYDGQSINYQYWSYLCRKPTTVRLDQSVFGPFNEGTKFFDILGMTKEQWKYVTNYFGERLNMQPDLFGVIRDAKIWFCGETNNKNNNWYANPENRKFVSLKQVPYKIFCEFVDTWGIEITNNIANFAESEGWGHDRYAFGYKFMDYLTKEYSNYYFARQRNGDPTKPLSQYAECQDRYKIMRYCHKHNVRPDIYDDYLRMRCQCQSNRSRLFNIDDWPLIPPTDKIAVFHDRLVELYNNSVNMARREQEQDNQSKYEKLLPKLRNFNYETENNNLCVICPEDLMEIVVEGQKLHHCVGSYTGSVANGNEVILFLRNKNAKNESYATIDVSYNTETKLWKARQIHTSHNGAITEDDVAFLKQWAKVKKIDESTIKTDYSALCAL